MSRRLQAADTPAARTAELAARIDAALPQTQCTRCGYPDCAAYAQAIAQGSAAINQCPPGGAEGIARLSAITGMPPLPLSAAHGTQGPRAVAFIDEAWCIGCTLCIKACPTDAIVGANKLLHSVIESCCTGCELCLPVCPVDCILLEPVSGAATGWAAWSAPLAQQARQRYRQHRERVAPAADPADGSSPPAGADSPAARKAAIATALERARRQSERGPR
ncbi:RnfABCDGE type electron transport complex subunit B [Verminephrobacter aporrectodeae]|uniref:RnfABCDGE type electron transport complex subunit B n=2 Tax=Verminephrobacter aporrectodeae TaxID=1110389 RepID=UPI002244F043|nr:RnfABCDGE type electron transport complex subunit B [Verminephrobacter aporrectodeae]